MKMKKEYYTEHFFSGSDLPRQLSTSARNRNTQTPEKKKWPNIATVPSSFCDSQFRRVPHTRSLTGISYQLIKYLFRGDVVMWRLAAHFCVIRCRATFLCALYCLDGVSPHARIYGNVHLAPTTIDVLTFMRTLYFIWVMFMCVLYKMFVFCSHTNFGLK